MTYQCGIWILLFMKSINLIHKILQRIHQEPENNLKPIETPLIDRNLNLQAKLSKLPGF